MGKSKSVDENAAERIKALRGAKDRRSFAEELGVTYTSVSNWETKINEPNSHTYQRMAMMAKGDLREWFLGKSKLPVEALEALSRDRQSEQTSTNERIVHIPIVSGAVAAGPPRNEPRVYESEIILPREMFSRRGDFVAVRIRGSSMEPVLSDGYIVIVDRNEKDATQLRNKMVVACDPSGAATVKWLRRATTGYMLVPHLPSVSNPTIFLTDGDGWTLAGRVVKWIGEPPK